MVTTIDMQDLRHLNLFEKVTRIRTRFCFDYNNLIVFCVPKPMVFKAIGKEGENLKRISRIVGKRVRVIPAPRGIQDVKSFIESIVNPVTFKNVEVTDDEVVVTAGGTQTKAALLGRNKQRLWEMEKIIKGFFEKDYRVA